MESLAEFCNRKVKEHVANVEYEITEALKRNGYFHIIENWNKNTRFPLAKCEKQGNKETYYINDGTPDGKFLVQIITNLPTLENMTHSITVIKSEEDKL